MAASASELTEPKSGAFRREYFKEEMRFPAQVSFMSASKLSANAHSVVPFVRL